MIGAQHYLMRNLIPVTSLLLFGCDLPDYKFPEVPKDENLKEPKIENTEKLDILDKPIPPSMTNDSIKHKQNPDKKFDAVNHFITRGKPIHAHPPPLDE